MSPKRSALLLPLLLAAALLPLSAAALPISIGASSQVQLGWQANSSTAVRLTRLGTQGTSGRFIQPADGSGTFAVYGTRFEPVPGQETFDYGSTLGDTTSIGDTRSSGFSVIAGQSTTLQITTPEPLGYFGRGNSVFGAFSR